MDLFEEVKASSGALENVPTELTHEELLKLSRIVNLRVTIQQAKEELNYETKACNHRAKYDVRSDMYDFRRCAVCDKSMGYI